MWSWHEEQCNNMIATEKFQVPVFRRAGGDVICEKCQQPYHDHPKHIPYFYLTILCNGDCVKL